MYPKLELEKYIFDCLYFYTHAFSIINKIKIKEVYGSHISNIDFLIMINEDIFLIKCKFESDILNLDNIKNFINDCEYLKTKIKKSYKFHFIYLTRIASVPFINNLNIYLYDYSTEINEFYLKEYEYLLMRLYNYIVQVTNVRLGLKEYLSDDILMSYII